LPFLSTTPPLLNIPHPILNLNETRFRSIIIGGIFDSNLHPPPRPSFFFFSYCFSFCRLCCAIGPRARVNSPARFGLCCVRLTSKLRLKHLSLLQFPPPFYVKMPPLSFPLCTKGPWSPFPLIRPVFPPGQLSPPPNKPHITLSPGKGIFFLLNHFLHGPARPDLFRRRFPLSSLSSRLPSFCIPFSPLYQRIAASNQREHPPITNTSPGSSLDSPPFFLRFP